MMPNLLQVAVATSLLFSLACHASTLTPPILPLIVRNPYLSTWLQDARSPPWSRWPMFWTGSEMGFSVMAAVPGSGKVYPLLGRPHDSLDDSSDYTTAFPLYMGANYDAATTNLTYLLPSPSDSSSEQAEVVLSFLSPITPTSTLRQALPASYISIHVKGSFDVNIYIDVNGQWVSGNRGNRIKWDLRKKNSANPEAALKTFRVTRETEQLLTEHNDHGEWGTLHFTAPIDVPHQAGVSARLRQRFAKTGTLKNLVDTNHRGIMEEEPVFAFAKSFKLANSTSSSDSVLFTIGHIQDPVVQYAAARGLTFMRPLWASWFRDEDTMLSFHHFDFENAVKLASNYSAQLANDAYEAGGSDYVDIAALSARQTIGATSFSGTPDNPILFLKEISSNGNFQTIDVIFPAFPFFLYTNPRWLAYLLEPLLEHMMSGQYPNKYAMHDLGAHFPNATGHADGRDEYMPVEECGDILIMGLALINSLQYDTEADSGSLWSSLGAGDFDGNLEHSPFALTSLGVHDDVFGIDDRWGGATKGTKQAKKWVAKTYPLWKQWTGYLVDFALEPQNQLSTDDFAGWLALQTNLALKGIIGIKAMSEIADLMGYEEDVKYYKNISTVYIAKWEDFAMSRDGTHAKLAYDWYGSWTTIYNLFADTLLCFHLPNATNTTTTTLPQTAPHFPPLPPPPAHDQIPLSPTDPQQRPLSSQIPFPPPSSPSSTPFIPHHIYTKQSAWYSAVMQRYGLPLDSRHLYTKTDWEFFAAAVASPSTKRQIIDAVALWINETVTDRPFTDLHNTEGRGGFPGPNFFARPVVGGHFSLVALGRACGGMAGGSFGG